MTGLTALPSLMPTLIPWTFTSILLILAVLVVRKFTQNWLSLCKPLCPVVGGADPAAGSPYSSPSSPP